MAKLKEIEEFGAIDAESDDLLAKCFEDHPAFREALQGRRFLILGRKGSGKTAIFKRISLLQLERPNFFSVGHTFADYPWHYHDVQVIETAAEQERYLHSWRYLVLLSLAKILLNFDQSQPHNERAHEALLKIENFVVDTYGSRDPDITQVFHPSKRVRHLRKTFGVDLKVIKAEFSPDELEMTALPKVFQDVNNSLQRLILDALNPANDYYVCFDQLDIGFSPEPRYQQRLIGLILASRDFVTAARQQNKNAKVLLFLRSDIYHRSLLFGDKNKITDTYSVDLEWDREDRPTLKSLMNRRVSELLSAGAEWEDVFDEDVEMRGHQTKYQHILDRTFRRPRDVIKFCNCVLSAYKSRRQHQNPPDMFVNEGVSRGEQQHQDQPDTFVNEDVYRAHNAYSTYLRDEIVDEIHSYYVDYQMYFEMLKEIGYQQFDRGDFKAAVARWGNRLKEPLPEDEILSRLYEFSIVGFYKAGGGGYGGAEYIYKYRDERAEFNRSAERFRVHWGLVEALGLRQYSRTERQESADGDSGN